MNPSKHPLKLDAGESVFFARELEYVKAKSYDVKYKQLKGLMLVPMSTEANTGVRAITWTQYSGVGLAKFISDYANDFPRVDVQGQEFTVKPKGIGDSYGYSIKEIRESQYSGKRLDQRRADFARRAIDEKMNTTVISGDAATGLQGFINYSGITEDTVIADGTGSSKLWSTKTPDQKVRDVTNLVNAVMNNTNGLEIPDTLLLPLVQYNDIANTRMGTNTDITILKWILNNSPVIKRIEYLVELDGAGAGGTDRMMVGAFDDMHLTHEVPQPFEQFDPQQKGMSFEIPCHAETAGVIIYYPLAFAFGDGI